jgi:alpha-tubulin suppressor-like RCC1 family protein
MRARRIAPLLLLAGVACGEDVTSPVAPNTASQSAAATAAAPLAFRQISMGLQMTCGVAAEDQAYCWGTGLFGDGSLSHVTRYAPRAVAVGLRFKQMSAGGGHICGLTTDGRAFCWGANSFGQLGDGTTREANTPVAVLGGLRFRQIRAGVLHTCAVTPDDVAYCWGSGQPGDGTTGPRLTPVAIGGSLRFRQVSVGSFYTCGATLDDRGYCWGDNREGQLGIGTFGGRNGSLVPVEVAGKHRFRQVIAGGSHTCGLTRDNRAFCWGLNRVGQLGDGTLSRRTRPAAVAGGRAFDAISPGGQHTCGQVLNGRMFCWGSNFSGQLGDGTLTNRRKPTAVAGGILFTGVSVSSRASSCGIGTDTRAYCWGEGVFGVLGSGTGENRRRPTPVAGPM